MTDTLLAVFTGVLTLAVLMQSFLFLLVFLSFRRLTKDLLPQIKKLTEKAEATLAVITDIAENIKPVARKMADSAEIIHDRVVDINGFLGEITEKSRREVAEIEDLLHDVTQRFRNAINILSDNIIMPIARINALTKAVRVATGVLFKRRKKEKTGTPEESSAASNDDTIFF